MNGFVTKQLGKKSRGLGTVLKTARSKADMTLEQVEGITKVPRKYLEALELGEFNRLPAEAYNLGYVRCYAQALHLNPDKIIALYKQERSDKWHQNPAAKVSFSPKRMGDWQFLVTPKLIGILGLVILFGGVGLYIASELKRFTSPPALEITSLPTESTSRTDSITLAGTTNDGAILTINSEPIFVGADGHFSQPVQLNPGVNQITLQAKNRADRVALKNIQVLYNPNLASAAKTATTD